MRSVLVIDDSAPFRKQLRKLLETGDYSVVGEAGTGRDGVEAAVDANPSLILVDIGLPDISGFEVAEQVGPWRVVLISGRDPRTFATQLEASTVMGFLSKEDLSLGGLEEIVSRS